MTTVALGGGWRLIHVTDRSIELRKDDVAYRQFIGRDGYVRVRGEPGMSRADLLAQAITIAQQNDAMVAERMAQQWMPRYVRGYQIRQAIMARAFGTPHDPEVIGVMRP